MEKIKIFSKTLAKTDVEHDLSVPTKHVDHFTVISGDQQAVDFVATDEITGIPWNFKCAVRNGRHPKPVLRSKGWNPFVRSKNLEEGDKISFYKSKDEATGETRFWVVAEKKFRLFGVTMFPSGN